MPAKLRAGIAVPADAQLPGSSQFPHCPKSNCKRELLQWREVEPPKQTAEYFFFCFHNGHRLTVWIYGWVYSLHCLPAAVVQNKPPPKPKITESRPLLLRKKNGRQLLIKLVNNEISKRNTRLSFHWSELCNSFFLAFINGCRLRTHTWQPQCFSQGFG